MDSASGAQEGGRPSYPLLSPPSQELSLQTNGDTEQRPQQPGHRVLTVDRTQAQTLTRCVTVAVSSPVEWSRLLGMQTRLPARCLTRSWCSPTVRPHLALGSQSVSLPSLLSGAQSGTTCPSQPPEALFPPTIATSMTGKEQNVGGQIRSPEFTGLELNFRGICSPPFFFTTKREQPIPFKDLLISPVAVKNISYSNPCKPASLSPPPPCSTPLK